VLGAELEAVDGFAVMITDLERRLRGDARSVDLRNGTASSARAESGCVSWQG
jgi:hypothetical protein